MTAAGGGEATNQGSHPDIIYPFIYLF